MKAGRVDRHSMPCGRQSGSHRERPGRRTLRTTVRTPVEPDPPLVGLAVVVARRRHEDVAVTIAVTVSAQPSHPLTLSP